jgi:flagellar motor switch protein FliG
MSNGKNIVITVYGHNKTIDQIAVGSFDRNESGAETYCSTINNLELKGDAWVFAKPISENTRYSLNAFFPLKFDIIITLHDLAIQKILREVDSYEIAKALKGENETIKEKIFNNMSKRAAKMLKEDMECMGPIRTSDVKEAQEKILMIIRHLEEVGEIVIAYFKGETTA